jgi:hypothetical protein
MKEDSLMASVKQPNDQNDPVSSGKSVALWADSEKPAATSALESQETTSSSLIDNWIDA